MSPAVKTKQTTAPWGERRGRLGLPACLSWLEASWGVVGSLSRSCSSLLADSRPFLGPFFPFPLPPPSSPLRRGVTSHHGCCYCCYHSAGAQRSLLGTGVAVLFPRLDLLEGLSWLRSGDQGRVILREWNWAGSSLLPPRLPSRDSLVSRINNCHPSSIQGTLHLLGKQGGEFSFPYTQTTMLNPA